MSRLMLLFLVCLPLFAQADISFTDLGKATKSPGQLQGVFNQEKYLAFLDVSLLSSGEFNYQRGESIRWVTQLPIDSELLMTPTQIINKQGDQELSRVSMDSNPAAKVVSDIFFAVLTADWEELSKTFSVQGKVDTSGWQASLKPLNDPIASLISHVEVTGDSYLRELTLYEVKGNRTRITFSDLQPVKLESSAHAR